MEETSESTPAPTTTHTGLGNILEEGEERMYGLVFRESSVAKSPSALSENRDLISGTHVLTQRTTTPKFERF